MDPFETLDRGRVEFRRVLAGVGSDHWELPTPCDAWDVRALVNHVLGGNVRYALLLHGAGTAEVDATRSLDHIGADALGSFDESAAEVMAAFDEPGALERTVHHPAGARSGLDLLWLRVAEWTVHAWDLARAIGGDEALDAGVVGALLARLDERGTGLETGGYFREAPPSIDQGAAPQTRLLLRVGRRP
ncbi:MAG: TIGR03086 family protein [Acidimicrobiia bacterium]|nr:TIGR03086 family protein [Acidimicrobiia bacterium]